MLVICIQLILIKKMPIFCKVNKKQVYDLLEMRLLFEFLKKYIYIYLRR